LPEGLISRYQQGINLCPRQNFQSSSSSPSEGESSAISAGQRQNAQNYAVEPLQFGVELFALPMVAYPLAREPSRVESALSKPLPKMDLKHAQRVPNVLWVCGDYVNLKNWAIGWGS